jgi:hypothetical protein
VDAIAIVRHSLKQIFGNLGAVLRISILLALIPLAFMLALGLAPLFADEAAMQRAIETGSMPWGRFLLFLLVAIVTAIWIAVAWHRFILLEEQPGTVLPAWKGDRVWSYLVASIIVILIGIVVTIVISLVMGLILAAILPMPTTMAGLIFVTIIAGLLIGVPIIVVILRIGPILPASAVGERLGVGGAWEATRGSTLTFAGVAVVIILISLALEFIGARVFGRSVMLAGIWGFAVQWFNLMLGLSIATTIYGHYVQRRPLV